MSEKVFINELQQIEIVFNEKVYDKELKVMLDKAAEFIKKNHKKQVPVHLLVNIKKINMITIESRKRGSNWLFEQPIDKVAVYGDNLFMKYFILMFTKGLGITDKMKFFVSRTEAQHWL